MDDYTRLMQATLEFAIIEPFDEEDAISGSSAAAEKSGDEKSDLHAPKPAPGA